MNKKFLFLCALTVFMGTLVSVSLADVPQPVPTVSSAIPQATMWAAIVSVFSPLVTYVLNSKLWAGVNEFVKSLVLVVGAAVLSGVSLLVSTGDFNWNGATLQVILAGVVTALAAHHFFWKANGVQQKLTS